MDVDCVRNAEVPPAAAGDTTDAEPAPLLLEPQAAASTPMAARAAP
jgi:hypothetical protein